MAKKGKKLVFKLKNGHDINGLNEHFSRKNFSTDGQRLFFVRI